MRKLSHICLILAFVLSNVMCAFVAYNYRDMLCGIEHAGYSAPAEISLLSAIPFVLLIFVCLILSALFGKKTK